ncbi:MAG: glycosyltransferase [Bacteroidota bacterium]
MQKDKELDKKKVLLVNLSRIWGGGEKWFYTVAVGLRKRGYQAELMVYPDSKLNQLVREADIPYSAYAVRALSLLNPFKLFQIWEELKRQAPQVVILNSSHELKVVGLVAKWAGVPHIIFRRGVSYAIKQNKVNRYYIRQIVTGFIANSQATYQAFLQAFPSIAAKPHLSMNNGIDVEAWRSQVKRTPKRYDFITTARLSPEKGLERAIQAVSLLVQKGLAVSYIIWGEGDQQAELKTLIEAHDLSEYVSLAGFSDQIPQKLVEGKIFLFTPHFGEGTSISLIEAMALELPCIVMDTPAMSEVVLDGETGYVVPDGNITQLADRMETLLKEEYLRLNMGKKASQRAEDHFTLSQILDSLDKWLESL